MDFSYHLQLFIKNNLEKIHGVEITPGNIGEVVFNHFTEHRKLRKEVKKRKFLKWIFRYE
jgi:predicted ABC-type exoprotein transport system permease subunit